MNTAYLETVSENEKIKTELENQRGLNLEILKKYEEIANAWTVEEIKLREQKSIEISNPLDLRMSMVLDSQSF